MTVGLVVMAAALALAAVVILGLMWGDRRRDLRRDRAASDYRADREPDG